LKHHSRAGQEHGAYQEGQTLPEPGCKADDQGHHNEGQVGDRIEADKPVGRHRRDGDYRRSGIVSARHIAANARDAMPQGGTFTVATRKVGERVEMRFTDTGPGVPEEVADRIFESFFTYGKGEGAGLGLSIARRIVEEHGGELRMESQKGRGATFVVSLPVYLT